MTYTQADYENERAICDKANIYVACNNAMRGRVERFELLRDMPDKFTAYLENDKPDGIGARLAVTCWPGDPLGFAVVNSIARRRGYTSTGQRYGRAVINGREYAWQGPGSGMYAHFRAIKGK